METNFYPAHAASFKNGYTYTGTDSIGKTFS